MARTIGTLFPCNSIHAASATRSPREAPLSLAPALAVLPAADEALVEAGWPL